MIDEDGYIHCKSNSEPFLYKLTKPGTKSAKHSLTIALLGSYQTDLKTYVFTHIFSVYNSFIHNHKKNGSNRDSF